jgi:DNA-binding transcriptional LysR family regulator
MKDTLVELDAVLAVARNGSFRAAALQLGVSTTTLSNMVAKVERQLGIRLFNRTTRSVALSDAGRDFIDRVGPAVSDIRAAMIAARSRQEVPSGTLRINAFATAAREVLAPLVLDFIRRYPKVHVDLVTEGRLVDIVADGFDLGLRSADHVPVDMISIPLRARSYVVAASPAYLARTELPGVPADLMQHACIRVRLPNGAPFRWPFEKAGQAIQIDPPGPITLDEASLSRLAALQGAGIGFFMEPDIRDDIAAGRLVPILEDWMPPLAPLCLYYANRRHASAAFNAFVQLARDYARGLPPA